MEVKNLEMFAKCLCYELANEAHCQTGKTKEVSLFFESSLLKNGDRTLSL